MDRRDVALVNQSFDQLGDSLLRNRMMEQQAGEHTANLGERKREFDVSAGQADRRTAVDEKNANTMANYRDQVLKDAKVQQGIAQIREQVQSITQMHKAGQINTAEANRKVKTLEKLLRQSPELMIRESGLADVNFQDVAREEKGEFNTAPIANSKRLAELREAMVDAEVGGDPAAIAKAKQALEDFQSLTRSGDDSQNRLGYEADKTRAVKLQTDIMDNRRRLKLTTAPESKARLETQIAEDQAELDKLLGKSGQVQAKPADAGKQLTLQQAQEFLKKAGGDKTKARELARQAGFTF